MPKFIALAHGTKAENQGDTNDDGPKAASKCFKFTQSDKEGQENTKQKATTKPKTLFRGIRTNVVAHSE